MAFKVRDSTGCKPCCGPSLAVGLTGRRSQMPRDTSCLHLLSFHSSLASQQDGGTPLWFLFLYFFCCQDNWVGFCSWLMAHGSGLRTQGRWLLTRPPLDLIRPIENAFRSRLDSQFKFNAQGNGNESKTNTHANCALSRGYSL